MPDRFQVHFKSLVLSGFLGFWTHRLQCHHLTQGTSRQLFCFLSNGTCLCWLLSSLFNHWVAGSLQQQDLELKPWSNTSHYAFCSAWQITWGVANAEAPFCLKNVSISSNFTRAHTCKSFQGELMELKVRKLSPALYILCHSPTIYSSHLKNKKVYSV